MNITIVGGGNIGTQAAVHCAEAGHIVTVFTSTPEIFQQDLTIVDEDGNITHKGSISGATSDPMIGFCDADLILVTLPPNRIQRCADTIFEYAKPDAVIGVMPGNGGTECMFRKCIERGNTFFLIERVPAIARLVVKGKSVRSVGYRNELHLSAIPASKAEKCCAIVQDIYGIPCVSIPCLFNLTLTPSNPILHTARMATIFRDYSEGTAYKTLPLFYEDWDDDSSSLLLKLDEELEEICKSLYELDLKYVIPLRLYYESDTKEKMTRKISGIPAFKGITTPSIRKDEGYIPDLHSRYFVADFSYGLSIIEQAGKITGVTTPYISDTMVWYRRIAVEKNEFRFDNYSILDRASLIHFYRQ